ncbi:hypothetical protein A0H76_51 [Hepatospora eriocheir]|uniref:Fam-b protein n=1 Tax=Hepatospora eriocheir TaxID=1081669 RepID=A0A1X0QEU0_9MICR|nr:hypothetical protein A0H76_51 [Hepatospora eriocheir]
MNILKIFLSLIININKINTIDTEEDTDSNNYMAGLLLECENILKSRNEELADSFKRHLSDLFNKQDKCEIDIVNLDLYFNDFMRGEIETRNKNIISFLNKEMENEFNYNYIIYLK